MNRIVALIVFFLIGSEPLSAQDAGVTAQRIPPKEVIASPDQSEALALELAHLAVNDVLYEHMVTVQAETLRFSMVEGSQPRMFRRAMQKDEHRYLQALVDTVRIVVPRDSLRSSFAAALRQRFTTDDLSQILAFARTSAGQRYLTLTSDQLFMGSFLDSLPTTDQTGLVVVLISQFHRHFPDMGFDKRAPR